MKLSLPRARFTVDQYLAFERDAKERHNYIDGLIYEVTGSYCAFEESTDMSVPLPRHRFTVDEYLAFERSAKERHIYIDGEIYAMAGESPAHGTVSVNLVASLAQQLRGTPCQAFTKDTKVRSGMIPLSGHSNNGFFSYPDVVVICGEPEYHDTFRDVILNPKAIFEVLSPSTESFDRSEKFERYDAWNLSLTDYVLISQDQPLVEHRQRKPTGGWDSKQYSGLDAEVPIPSVQCTLKLRDVYDRIVFPTQA